MTLQAFSYAVVLTVSDEDAVNPEVVVTLDASLTFVSASGTGWTCNEAGGVVTCTRAAGAVGALPTITINVTSPAVGETSTTTADADADNATDPATQDSETTVSKTVTKDATSGKRFPADATQWQNLIDCTGITVAVPSRLWLCQDASGDLAAAIGANALTAGTSPLYEQAVTGLTRLGVAGDDNTADQFGLAAGVGTSPATGSQSWLCVGLMPATPAGDRTFFGLNLASTTAQFKIRHAATTGYPRVQVVATDTDGGVSISSTLDVHAITMDRTASYQAYYNSSEKVVPTYSALVLDGAKGILRGSAAKMAMVVEWSGANGEITSAQMKALMQALGYSPAWTA